MPQKREFTGVFIPAHIWSSKELIPSEKMILGEILALSQSRGYCDASRQHFADWLSCSVQNVSFYFTKLERLGFIFIEKIPGYRSKIRLNNERFYEDSGVNGTDGGGKPGLPEIQVKREEEIKDKDTCGSDSANPVLDIPKNKKKENEKTAAAAEILAHLNEKAGRAFNAEKEQTLKPIIARMNEKMTVEDAKRVIAYKCAKWLNDPKMKEYLRPQTLFGTNFWTYLEEATPKQPKPQPQSQNVSASNGATIKNGIEWY